MPSMVACTAGELKNGKWSFMSWKGVFYSEAFQTFFDCLYSSRVELAPLPQAIGRAVCVCFESFSLHSLCLLITTLPFFCTHVKCTSKEEGNSRRFLPYRNLASQARALAQLAL